MEDPDTRDAAVANGFKLETNEEDDKVYCLREDEKQTLEMRVAEARKVILDPEISNIHSKSVPTLETPPVVALASWPI